MSHSIYKTITKLLGREPRIEDGVPEAALATAEKRMGRTLPVALRELYLRVGQNPMLMGSFNRFATVDDFQLVDGKILFLEENQNVCRWACDASSPDCMVFMQPRQDGEWMPEMPLDIFLELVLYYQCAEGGYEFCGTLGLDDEEFESALAKEWKVVVESGGLFIAWKPDCLLWYLFEEESGVIQDYIYLSARSAKAYAANEAAYLLEKL